MSKSINPEELLKEIQESLNHINDFDGSFQSLEIYKSKAEALQKKLEGYLKDLDTEK